MVSNCSVVVLILPGKQNSEGEPARAPGLIDGRKDRGMTHLWFTGATAQHTTLTKVIYYTERQHSQSSCIELSLSWEIAAYFIVSQSLLVSADASLCSAREVRGWPGHLSFYLPITRLDERTISSHLLLKYNEKSPFGLCEASNASIYFNDILYTGSLAPNLGRVCYWAKYLDRNSPKQR